MGRGMRQGGSGSGSAAPWPALLPGDYVEIESSPGAIMPLDGALAEVNGVDDEGCFISVIVGSFFTSLDWDQGDRWQKSLPPETGQGGLRARFLRSDASPSAGLATAHSYRDRPESTHPVVLATKTADESWDGWLKGEAFDLSADDSDLQRLLRVVDCVWSLVFDNDSSAGWEEDVDDSLDGIDPVLVRKAVDLGELLCEADCMNSGFILHTYTPDLELRIRNADDRKGLEAVIELMEELGWKLELERDGG